MMRGQIEALRQNRIARNALWLFTGQGLSLVLQSAYFVALARLLGSMQYGIYAGTIALVSMVAQYSTMGSGLLFVRYVSADHTLFARYWCNILAATAIFGTFLVVVLHFTASRLVSPASAAIIVIVAVSECLFGQLTANTGQVFQAFEKMRLTATLNLLTSLVRCLLAGAMLALLHHASARAWALGSLCVSALACVLALVIVSREFGAPVLSFALLRKRAFEGLTFAVSGSTTSAYNDIDKAMLSHYGMNVANGLYSMAYRVVDIATMPVRSVQAAAVPRFFQKGAEGILPAMMFARRIVARTSVAGLGSAVLLFLAAPVIPHLVGHAFDGSVSALRWLCLIPFFRSFHLSAGDAITATGHQGWRLLTQLMAALLNFGANLVLIPHFGWLGAAWASLGTDALLGCANWFLLYQLLRRETAHRKAVPQVAA